MIIVEKTEDLWLKLEDEYLQKGFYGKIELSVFDGFVNHVEIRNSIDLTPFTKEGKTNEK